MADFLEVIGDPNRRRLVQLLGAGEATVNKLTAHFSISRSAISQHLLLLAEVGLVVARKEGRNRFYQLKPEAVLKLQAQFDSFWNAELATLESEAEILNQARTRPNSKESSNGV